MEHHNQINKNKQLGMTPKTVQTTGVYIQDNRTKTIVQKKANNTGFPDNLKSGIESLSGHSMDGVKVHYNSDKPAQLNAHAYAQGNQIHIASGQEKHLPHEAWHVVQQKQGRVKPTLQMKGKMNVNDENSLEKEANLMGEKTLMQKKESDSLKSVPLKTNLGFNQTVQRILNAKNVISKGQQFLAAHEAERQLIIQANTLLTAFSEHASGSTLKALNTKLLPIRDATYAQTNAQSDLIQEYIDTADEAIRKTFLDTVLQKDSAVLKPLFNTLINQTPLGMGVDIAYKRKFLSYVLQGMKFIAGEGRFIELMGLLGDRNIEINHLPEGPSAGLASEQDDPLGEKTNRRNKATDANLLEEHDGNLSEFIKTKFGGADTRGANPAAGTIGDARVNMASDQQLFPIYYGHTATKDVQAFTSPMFAANHHELGHVVNKLKGKAGFRDDRYRGDGILTHLTDEEEVYNISIDQHSDKALTTNLGLPERIAHGAMSKLDANTPEVNGDYMFEDLNKWDKHTYNLSPGRKKALELIKRIADANWKEYTKYGSKPSGVKKIMTEVGSIKNMGLGMKKQLEAIRKIAITAAGEKSSDRKFQTSKFYEILSQMIVDTKNGLEILEIQLEVLIEMGNF